MEFISHNGRLLACIATAIFAAGCGQGSNAPVTVPVTGKVTLGGEPVAAAIVSLTPTAGSADAVPAQATTNESGEFEVQSVFNQGRDTQAGMTPGEYTLTVTKLEQLPAQTQITRAPKNLLPKQYESTASSNLKATISVDGDNVIAVDLKK